MLLFYMLTAVLFTVRSGFFQFTGVKIWLSRTVGSLIKRSDKQKGEGISQYGAFCSVLAACIGTGNIVGVASAIACGGAGAVFWMWFSALLSMMTSYAENTLAISYRRIGKDGKRRGGAFSYMEHGAKMPGMARVYAFLCFFSSLGSGNMTQSNSVSESILSGFGVPRAVTGIICALLCFIIVRGGVKRIAKINEAVVPVMGSGFLILSAWLLIEYRRNVLSSVVRIFTEAFSVRSLNGFGMYKAVRYGIARGVFSNEAGLGSSTLLHSEADSDSPEEQGLWGMFEVFCDTVLLCTVTALAILASGVFDKSPALFGAELSINAYSVLGEAGKKGIAALTAVFGFASLTGWSFYGEKSGERLFGRDVSKYYRLIYPLISFVGSISSPAAIWSLSDITNGLMALPNLFSLVLLRNEVPFINRQDAFSRKKSRPRLYQSHRSDNP